MQEFATFLHFSVSVHESAAAVLGPPLNTLIG